MQFWQRQFRRHDSDGMDEVNVEICQDDPEWHWMFPRIGSCHSWSIWRSVLLCFTLSVSRSEERWGYKAIKHFPSTVKQACYDFLFENVYNILLGSHAKQHVFQSDKINRKKYHFRFKTHEYARRRCTRCTNKYVEEREIKLNNLHWLSHMAL